MSITWDTFDWSLTWRCFLSTLTLTLAKHLQFGLSATLTAFPAGWAMSCLCCLVSLAVPGQVSNICWCRKCWSPGRYSSHVLINHIHLILFQPIISLSFFARSVYHFSYVPLSLLRFQAGEKVRKFPDGYQRIKILKPPQIIRNIVTIRIWLLEELVFFLQVH